MILCAACCLCQFRCCLQFLYLQMISISVKVTESPPFWKELFTRLITTRSLSNQFIYDNTPGKRSILGLLVYSFSFFYILMYVCLSVYDLFLSMISQELLDIWVQNLVQLLGMRSLFIFSFNPIHFSSYRFRFYES